MKREGIRCELQRAGNRACRHSLRSGLNQQSEHVETIVLGKRRERRDGIYFFHTSTNMEILPICQRGQFENHRIICPYATGCSSGHDRNHIQRPVLSAWSASALPRDEPTDLLTRLGWPPLG